MVATRIPLGLIDWQRSGGDLSFVVLCAGLLICRAPIFQRRRGNRQNGT
jgi:hypothetical protein